VGETTIELNPDELHHIFSIIAIQVGTHKAVQLGLVATDQRFKGYVVACKGLFEQQSI